MNLAELKTKLWFNIFIRIAAIFAGFVLILSICNISMLLSFFCFKEKFTLKEQLLNVSELDIYDTDAVSATLSDISEKYHFDIEIYNSSGVILYTTHFGQMMDYYNMGGNRLTLMHEAMLRENEEDMGGGVIFYNAVRRMDSGEYLVCEKQISDSIFAEVRIKKALIASSAAIANEFILIVSAVCFVLTIIWVFFFAKRFSNPIVKMSETTKAMTRLDFSRHLTPESQDEIGELAVSINYLSDSLSSALDNLKATNAKLQNEIELERKLDVMRKGFVANVSHELKTPISIISGYAEGLKYNINSDSKEEYCDTIIDESNRMNKLVLSILELSKYESGQIPVTMQPFNIFEQAQDMLIRIFKGKNINIENNIPENLLVFADAFQIEQVFKALLENAAVHTPDNGSVIVSTENSGENKIRISIFNSGSYIEPEHLPQIWQSFFRGDTSHKRESGRFGLGLSIVSAIMKMHGESFGAKNRENGVEFWFELQKYTEEIKNSNP